MVNQNKTYERKTIKWKIDETEAYIRNWSKINAYKKTSQNMKTRIGRDLKIIWKPFVFAG